MSSEIVDITGRQVEVGDHVACGIRSGNSGGLLIGQVDGIDWYPGDRFDHATRTFVPAMYPKLVIKPLARTGYEVTNGDHHYYAKCSNVVKIDLPSSGT